jgi:hypothetical protein
VRELGGRGCHGSDGYHQRAGVGWSLLEVGQRQVGA